MKKILLVLVVLMSMSCNLCGESEFKHMPTYEKTCIYTDRELTVYMIKEFDGYETKVYYINQDSNIVSLSILD